MYGVLSEDRSNHRRLEGLWNHNGILKEKLLDDHYPTTDSFYSILLEAIMTISIYACVSLLSARLPLSFQVAFIVALLDTSLLFTLRGPTA